MKKIWIIIVAGLLFAVPFMLSKEASVKDKTIENKCDLSVTLEGEKLPLEQYVRGVVAAEMPAAYELEALKAQAIAARTYALYKQQGEGELKASVAHQVFYDEEQRKERWATNFETYESKIERAVEETSGEIISYKGELISAMFHAASNGKTESAKAYSGNDIPYLQSVPSPEKEKKTVEVTSGKWTAKQLLNAQLMRNESGRVEQVKLGDQMLTGRQVRETLNLRSTDFQFELVNGEIVATTRGYGHGVGMSQQGAQEMALNGAKAEDIITHYYSGVEIKPIACES